jgi:hypothetical protein
MWNRTKPLKPEIMCKYGAETAPVIDLSVIIIKICFKNRIFRGFF